MKYLTGTAIMVLAAASLAACGKSESANDQAQTNGELNSSAETSAPNPFADSEQKMNDAMMAAVGSDAGQSWAKKMIAHHQGAIDMSQAVLQQNPTPDVAQMARDGIKKQQMDIDDIKKLLKDGSPDQKSADLYGPAMMDMKQKMDAAMGSNASDTFLRKMLEHHKGAGAMSDVALKNGVTGTLKAQVQKTRDENAKDAKMVEAMLAGTSMQQAMKQSGSMTADQMAKMPKPTARSDQDMNAMGNMDMNNM